MKEISLRLLTLIVEQAGCKQKYPLPLDLSNGNGIKKANWTLVLNKN